MTSINRRYRKQIESLRKRIAEHQQKIVKERQKVYPNEGFIQHWEVEILAWQEAVAGKVARLRRRK